MSRTFNPSSHPLSFSVRIGWNRGRQARIQYLMSLYRRIRFPSEFARVRDDAAYNTSQSIDSQNHSQCCRFNLKECQ